MKTLNKQQEKEVTKRMAKEFLEYRLGIDTTDANVRRLAAHILQFEKEVDQQMFKKSQTSNKSLTPVNQQKIISGVKACHA